MKLFDNSQNLKDIVLKEHYFITQQTPKPEAQFPSLVPPASPHSVADKQVPKVKSSLPDVHWALGNETTESIDNCP